MDPDEWTFLLGRWGEFINILVINQRAGSLRICVYIHLISTRRRIEADESQYPPDVIRINIGGSITDLHMPESSQGLDYINFRHHERLHLPSATAVARPTSHLLNHPSIANKMRQRVKKAS